MRSDNSRVEICLNARDLLCGRDNLAILFCVYFSVLTDKLYRKVQLIQNKEMKEMFLINFPLSLCFLN